MSVLSVTLLKSRHASINEKFERQYTLTYDVLMTSPHDGGLLAMSAVGWAVGNDYSTSTEFDTLAKVKQIGSDCESDDGKRWKVTVEFGKIDPQQQENPLAVPIILEWGSAQYEYEATQDVNGKPIANKAGDPIPGEKKEASRPILTVKRNEQVDPSQLATLYQDTVNQDPFIVAGQFIGDSKMVKFNDVTARRQVNELIGPYFECEYHFAVRQQTWAARPLNAGYRQLVGGKLQDIMINGAPASSPVLLKKNGAVAKPTDAPIFLKFDIYPSTDFSIFNF